MPQQTVNVGSAANDGTGDFVRQAWQKANANFTELYDFTVAISGTTATLQGDVAALEATLPTKAEGLTGNTVVNVTTSDSTAGIQAMINAQPRNLRGYTLTFQFADGLHILTDTLYFRHFHGGRLIVQGNAGDTTLSSTKAVTLQSGANLSALKFEYCQYPVTRYLRFVLVTPSTNPSGIYYQEAFSGEINACAFTNDTLSATDGSGWYVRWMRSTGAALNSSFNYGHAALYAAWSFVQSSNHSSVNASTNGLTSVSSTVFRIGTQPGGAESTETGGQIL